MNPLLRSGLVSLVTGFLFVAGLGLGLAVLYYIPWPSNKPNPTVVESSYTNFPADLKIKDHARIIESPDFLVRGTLINAGAGTWYAPTIELTVLAGGVKMNSCSIGSDAWLLPGDEYAFTILCRGVTGGDLPEFVTYELVVRSANGG